MRAKPDPACTECWRIRFLHCLFHHSDLLRFVLLKLHPKWLQLSVANREVWRLSWVLFKAARPLKYNNLPCAGTFTRRAPEGRVFRNSSHWPKDVCCPSSAGFCFRSLDFGFVSGFDIRISNFLATDFWFWLCQVRISDFTFKPPLMAGPVEP